MTPGDLSALQRILTRLLRHFDSACRDAGVDYFLDCGTLLGALRYGGWIPWDDDVDVVMWREDYERLREYRRAHPDPQTHIYDPLREHGWSVIPRFAIRGTTRTNVDFEHLQGHREESELLLDIFVIDTAPASTWLVGPWLRVTLFLQDLRLTKGIDRARMRLMRSPRRRRVLTAAWLVCHLLPERFVQWAYLRAATAFTGRSETGYCLNSERLWRAHPLPRSWFTIGRQIHFEGHDYRCPDPDPYLRQMYGPDYLTPPPPSQRTGHNVESVRGRLDELSVDVCAVPASHAAPS